MLTYLLHARQTGCKPAVHCESRSRFKFKVLGKQSGSQATLCRKLLYDYEKSQELAIIKRKNIGSFYRFVNRKLPCKTGVGPLRSETGDIITDDISKAFALNKYFRNVFTDDDMNMPDYERRVADNIAMKNVIFLSYLVFKTLSKCKTSRSLDPDGFCMSFVKKLKSTLAYPLAILFTHF